LVPSKAKPDICRRKRQPFATIAASIVGLPSSAPTYEYKGYPAEVDAGRGLEHFEPCYG
jgi:hypothetical protein